MRDRVVRLALFAGALFVAGLTPVAAFAQSAAAKPIPKMIVAKSEHDFGKVKEGEKVSFTFVVRNEGAGELVIANVSPSCECTSTEFSKTVAPGQEGKITVSVNTAGLAGDVSRYADVISNDKTQVSLKLWVHLQVQKTGTR